MICREFLEMSGNVLEKSGFFVYLNCIRTKKTVQKYVWQSLVKFPPTLVIFGTKMEKRLKLCPVHSFSTSPNLRQRMLFWDTAYNANVVLNCHCSSGISSVTLTVFVMSLNLTLVQFNAEMTQSSRLTFVLSECFWLFCVSALCHLSCWWFNSILCLAFLYYSQQHFHVLFILLS